MTETVQARDIHGAMHTVCTDRLRWRPAVYALLTQEDKLLVLPVHDRFDIPGGGVEFGEMPEAAVIREVREETGLHIGPPKLFRMASSFFRMPDAPDDFIQTIMLYYTAAITGGTLSQAGMDAGEQAHVQLAEWKTLDELKDAQLTSAIDWRVFAAELLKAS